ncbi:hypothetical protein GQ457_HM000300 [Hibiscus cannabinus]
MDNKIELLPLSFTFLVFIFMAFKLRMRSKIKDSSKNLPPAPPPKLPLIGHLHLLLFSLPHRRLAELAKRHGSLMHLQLGELPHVVVSSPETAKQVMKSHDTIFANRPFLLAAAEVIAYNFSDIISAPYEISGGSFGDLQHRSCLSTKRVQLFRSIREEHVSGLIRSIFTKAGSEINLGEMFIQLDVADLFPSIGSLAVISGMRAKIKRIHHGLDAMLEIIIEEHRASSANPKNVDDATEDLVDVLLNLQYNCFSGHARGWNRAVFVCSRMGDVGMLRNPRILEKAQAEVRQESMIEKDMSMNQTFMN